jgi:predicted amidophosphoribosyltransferase
LTGLDIGLVVSVALGSFDHRDPLAGTGLHGLVQRFRAGDPNAADEAWRAATDILVREPDLRSSSIAAVPVPTHDGPASHALAALVARLAPSAGWRVPVTGALVRVDAIVEAKRRLPRDPAAEVASLHWSGAAVPEDLTTVLLVDDVLASGATLQACLVALRRDGWRGEVRALVLARAI